MANFAVTQSSSIGFAWQITGLSKPWTSYYFTGLFSSGFTSGNVTPIASELLNNIIGPAPAGGYAIPFGEQDTVPSSYPYSWLSSDYYGSNSITVYPAIYDAETGRLWSVSTSGTVAQGQAAAGYTFTPSSSRPELFYWSSYGTRYSPQNRTTVSGKMSIYLPYEKAWNALRTNIIAMLVYKGIIANSSAFFSYVHYFDTVLSGQLATSATLYNKAARCINAMGGSVPIVTAGVTAFTENYFYYLQYYLNAIS